MNKEEELSYIRSRKICLQQDIEIAEKEIEELNRREKVLKNRREKERLKNG